MDAVQTLMTPLAILAMVTILRDLGLPARLAPLVAIVLGVALSIAAVLFADSPIFGAIASGILLALTASGVYDGARLISGNAGKPEGNEIGRAYVSIQPVPAAGVELDDPDPDASGLAPLGVAG